MTELLSGLPGPAATAVYFMLSLFPLVLVHELGHFVVAKLNGIHVEEFGIGFPPRLFKLFRIAETDYTINVLPLGGFVRLVGEDDPDVPGAFAARGKLARAAVLSAGPIANFVLAAGIFTGLAVVGGMPGEVPSVRGVGVLDVLPDWPAAEAGIQVWDIVVAVDGEPLADRTPDEEALIQELVDLTDAHTGQEMHLTVLRGAQGLEVEQPDAPLTTDEATLPGVTAERVTDAPADSALRPGDLIVGRAGEELEVLRGVEAVELTVTPRLDEATESGKIGVSIGKAVVPTELAPLPAVARGLETTGLYLQLMVTSLAQMATGNANVDLKGPVGISELSKQAGERGLEDFLGFVALLSLNLGLINLLPIPALDGGRLMFIAAEAVRGRRVEPAREAVVHLIGFVLVIGLMVAITVYEVWGIGGQ